MRQLKPGAVGGFVLILLSCAENSSERACEPASGTGCEGAARCIVAEDGAPACVTGGDTRAEGDPCTAVDDCAVGLGCVSIFGVSRCLRFCVPPESDDDRCQTVKVAPVADGADHRLGNEARCVASLPDRPDIGVCVLPCELFNTEDACPSCGLSFALGMATCMEAGVVPEGGLCGAGALCEADLFCEPNSQTCRVPAVPDGQTDAEKCPAGGAPVTIPGTADPTRFGKAYAVCVAP